MNPIRRIAKNISSHSREERAKVFRSCFNITAQTKILDLGSEDGSNIANVLCGTDYDPQNIYIADIDKGLIQEGSDRYGFIPVLIDENENQLRYPNKYFDIVYCSSVIEHVTIPKSQVWTLTSGTSFKQRALLRQRRFATEIRRLGKRYFVQTPYKYFPIESHTWLPLVGFLPRVALIPVLKITNLVWIKKTSPDWHLLNKKQMWLLFPDANEIVTDKLFGLVKSIMVIRNSET